MSQIKSSGPEEKEEDQELSKNQAVPYRIVQNIPRQVLNDRRFAFFEWTGPVQPDEWRAKEKMRTLCVCLCMCLNLYVDPPDNIRAEQSANIECWVDPSQMPRSRAMETIGANMEKQYKRWQPRARISKCMDPCKEQIYRSCVNFRKIAKKERVLFHYNGHGVPRATPSGEIWCFDKDFLMYISVPIMDVCRWLDSPNVFILDCAGAENILNYWITETGSFKDGDYRGPHKTIILCACRSNETLPTNPEYPADVFTACLTTPIVMSLKWFVTLNNLTSEVNAEMLDVLLDDGDIVGAVNKRNTPLNELNRIFTSVTDGIAWNVVSDSLFFSIFRQDQLIASLFRNFLLAERVMTALSRTPVSYPSLPTTSNHPLWEAWDLAVEETLNKLKTRWELTYGRELRTYARKKARGESIEKLRGCEMCDDHSHHHHHVGNAISPIQKHPYAEDVLPDMQPGLTKNVSELTTLRKKLHIAQHDYQRAIKTKRLAQAKRASSKRDMLEKEESIRQLTLQIKEKSDIKRKNIVTVPWESCPFFEHQLQAFRVWLENGDPNVKPIQLPIILQLLLSQSYRLKALKLFALFFDRGRLAVSQALRIDIFPYIQKLLKTTNDDPIADREKHETLVAIWSKTLVFDPRCKQDLAKQQYCNFFVDFLKQVDERKCADEQEADVQLIQVFVIMATIADKFGAAQRWFLEANVLTITAKYITSPDAHVRLFALLLLSKLWENCEDAKMACVEREIADRVMKCFRDTVPEVRAAAVEAIGTLFGSTEYDSDGEKFAIDIHLGKQVARQSVDGSCLVRAQVVSCLGKLFYWQKMQFQSVMKGLQKYQSSRARERKTAQHSLRRIKSLPSVETSHPAANIRSTPSLPNVKEESVATLKLQQSQLSPELLGCDMAKSASTNALPNIVNRSNTLSPLLSSSANSDYQSPLFSPHLPPVPDPSPLLHAVRPHEEDEDPPPSLSLGPAKDCTDESRLFICRLVYRLSQDPHDRVMQSATNLRKRILNYATETPKAASNHLHTFPQRPQRSNSFSTSPVGTAFLKDIETQFFEWCCHRLNKPIREPDVIDHVQYEVSLTIRGIPRQREPKLRLPRNNGKTRKREPRTKNSGDSDTLSPRKVPSKPTPRELSGLYENHLAGHRRQMDTFSETLKDAKVWGDFPCRVPRMIEKQIFNLKPRASSQFCFHPYEFYLYTAARNQRNTEIQVWNLNEVDAPVNAFPSSRSRSSSRSLDVSSLAVANEFHAPILVAGSSDGSVRLWKNVHNGMEQRCISAFRALPQPRQRSSSSINRLRLAWNPQLTHITAAGCSSDIVRVWDVTKEQCVSDLSLGGGKTTCVTNLPYDENLTVIGLDSGSVALIDRREAPGSQQTILLHPSSRVVKVAPHRRIIASASLNGRVCFSDPRILRDNQLPAAEYQINNAHMDVFDAHPYAPVIAAKNQDREGHYVSVYSTENYQLKEISSIRFHRGFLGQRIGPISCLEFHPHYCILAVGDSELISLHQGKIDLLQNRV